MQRSILTAALAALALGSAPAFAQEAPADAPAASPAEQAREAVEATGPEAAGEEASVEDSAILPSADDHEASRAPSMDLDCEAAPQDCIGEPIIGETEGPAPSAPQDPAATATGAGGSAAAP